MGKKIKMLNEHHIKALLQRDDIDFNKFYKEELIEFIEVAKQENQELKERLERIDNYIDKNYTMENQYWFDHIRDIIKDR